MQGDSGGRSDRLSRDKKPLARLQEVVRRVVKAKQFIVKGDLHCHSNFSPDCTESAEQVIADSRIAGYDFIALTEHNTLLHMKAKLGGSNLLVVSGCEVTTQLAHVNVFGLRSFPLRTALYTKERLLEYLGELRDLGGILQLNHPNDRLNYSHCGYDFDFQFIEIINKVFSEEDRRTLQDYQTLLCQGRKLVATGGSDTHCNYKERKVFNCVLVNAKTESAILAGLTAGRNYVTVEANGPEIRLTCDDAVMGGTVAYHENQQVIIRIDKIALDTIVKIYTSNGLVVEETYSDPGRKAYVRAIPTRGIKFCRVELWFDQENVCAFSNPIYVENKLN